MSPSKERMTVTVERALIAAAKHAVASGRASSLSAWVNAALAERAAKERHLRAMADAVAAYEEQFGALSAAELIAQEREDHRTSLAVREPRRKSARRRPRAA